MQSDNSLFTGTGVVIDRNDMWILTEDTNAIMHFDLCSMRLLDYHVVLKEKIVQCSHLGLQKNGNILFAIPFSESNLISFDISSYETRYIEIPYRESEADRNNKFSVAISWESYLILAGANIPGIFYYNIVSGRFTRDTRYLDKLEASGCDLSRPLFSENYFQNEENVYIPVYSQNFILKINLKTRTNIIYELKNENKIELCTIDGFYQNGKEKFLLTTTNDEMLIWNQESGIEEIKKLGVLTVGEKTYKRAFHIKGKNYYISAYERKVFVERNGIIREMEFDYESRCGFDGELGYVQFEVVLKRDEDIFFQARSNGQLFKIDTEADRVYSVEFDVEEEKKEEIISCVCDNREMSVLYENACLSLDVLLRLFI